MESPFKAELLKGKVALLTGGASGIGYEISVQLGKHGASVAVMGRRKHVIDSAVEALRSQGVSAIGFEGDVRKRDDAARVLESTVKHFGRLDILVNAAAGNFLVPSEDLSPNGFRTVIDIDAVGTFTMCHEALKYLKKGASGKNSAAGGSIINISATLHYTATWYQIHVSAAKAAVDSITRSLALEWGTDYDIRVNGIAPGPIEDTAGFSKLLPQEMLSKPKEQILVSKLGKKWDIAMAALYLSSDAGKYINGTTLVVDGGEWLTKPAYFPKEAVKQLSRAVERRLKSSTFPRSYGTQILISKKHKLQMLDGMYPQRFRHINDLARTPRSVGDMRYLKNTPPRSPRLPFDIQVFHLNVALERHILSEIPTQMIVQSALVNPLVMQSNQIHNHQDTHQKPTNHNPHKNPVILPAVHHHGPENRTDNPADGQVPENEHEGHPNLPLEQLIALLHGGEPVDGLEHGDHAGQKRRKMTMPEKRSRKEFWIVAEHEEGDPEESDEEALEDFWDCREGVGERDGLGGVEGGGGEDDGGGGEEGEGEEEDEVAELEEEEEGPFLVELGGVGGRALELVEERVGEEGVGEDGEGERED
ncbi:unnamed protein product [Malus baccata var. baccata]